MNPNKHPKIARHFQVETCGVRSTGGTLESYNRHEYAGQWRIIRTIEWEDDRSIKDTIACMQHHRDQSAIGTIFRVREFGIHRETSKRYVEVIQTEQRLARRDKTKKKGKRK